MLATLAGRYALDFGNLGVYRGPYTSYSKSWVLLTGDFKLASDWPRSSATLLWCLRCPHLMDNLEGKKCAGVWWYLYKSNLLIIGCIGGGQLLGPRGFQAVVGFAIEYWSSFYSYVIFHLVSCRPVGAGRQGDFVNSLLSSSWNMYQWHVGASYSWKAHYYKNEF